MADLVDALRPHGVREKVPVPILGTDYKRIGESSDITPNAEVNGEAVYLTGGGREESLLPPSRVPMLKIRPERKPQFTSKSTISDMNTKWSQTLGSQGRAQLYRLKYNKNLRRSLGIDDGIFNSAVRGADNGDVDSVKYLEQFTGPLEHLRYERGVAERKEAFQQELGELRGKEDVKVDTYTKKQGVKLGSDKNLAMYKYGLKDKPDELRRTDKLTDVLDDRMERILDQQTADTQTADILAAAPEQLKPILQQRIKDHLRENQQTQGALGDKSTEAKQRDWAQAMARAGELKNATPEQRRPILEDIAKFHGLDPARFIAEAEMRMPVKSREDLNKEAYAELVWKARQGYQPTPNEQTFMDWMVRREASPYTVLRREDTKATQAAGAEARGNAPTPAPVQAGVKIPEPGSDEFFAEFERLTGNKFDPDEAALVRSNQQYRDALVAVLEQMRKDKK